MGQLLVVLPVKQKLALPELIPDPLCHHKHCSCGTKKVSRAMDLGSVGNRKRPMRNASTFLLIPKLQAPSFKRPVHRPDFLKRNKIIS